MGRSQRRQEHQNGRDDPQIEFDETIVRALRDEMAFFEEVADDERWLEQRMQALPSTEYQVLHLRQVERKTDQQIAAILGIGIASVPTLLSRARRKLMQAMLARQRKE